MKVKAASIGIVLTALTWTNAHADIISTDDITDSNPSAYDPFTLGISNDSNITASGIGRGAGITGSSAINRYSARSWSTGAFDGDDYFTFTLDAKNGHEINFDSLVYTGQASGTGPTAFAFRSSLDGFTTNIGSPTATGTSIDLSVPAYQHIKEPIEFRLYGYSASSAAGTFSVNNYTFNGTVTAVPEPNTLALVGIGSLLMLGNQRRKRKLTETVE